MACSIAEGSGCLEQQLVVEPRLITDDWSATVPQGTDRKRIERLIAAANAGRDQLVIVNNPVALTGSATDPDGDVVTYNWAVTAKPAGSYTQFEPGPVQQTSLPPQ